MGTVSLSLHSSSSNWPAQHVATPCCAGEDERLELLCQLADIQMAEDKAELEARVQSRLAAAEAEAGVALTALQEDNIRAQARCEFVTPSCCLLLLVPGPKGAWDLQVPMIDACTRTCMACDATVNGVAWLSCT